MKMIEADNKIILDKDGSYIDNKRTGSRIKINHEGGAFTFEFWVPGVPVQKGTGVAPSINQPVRKTKISSGKYDAFNEDADDMEVNTINMVLARQEDLL